MGELCTACLCAGRNLFCIGDTGFYHLYSQILNEIQVYDASSFYLKVCWECVARLRRWHHFRERAKHSYTQLYYVHQTTLSQPSPIPSALQTSETYSFSCPELLIKAETAEGPAVSPGLDIKTEETHCEPETFANDLEPRRRKTVKKDAKVSI
uniref:SFRICE_018484 n=1 Tax=Spodoptera frugiperda TaxID=7108 RepID=A0A2H1V011_SPOFR